MGVGRSRVRWGLGHRAQKIGFLVLCTRDPEWLAACTVGSVFGVMSVQRSEYWLLCHVGSVIGPVGDQAGGRNDDGGSGGAW